jgi:hypothetical protein
VVTGACATSNADRCTDDEGAAGHGKLISKPGCIEVTFIKVAITLRSEEARTSCKAQPPFIPPAPTAAAANSKAGINGVIAGCVALLCSQTTPC